MGWGTAQDQHCQNSPCILYQAKYIYLYGIWHTGAGVKCGKPSSMWLMESLDWDFLGIGIIPAAFEQGEGLAELWAPILSCLNIINIWKYRPTWSLEDGFKGIPGEEGVKAVSKVFRSTSCFSPTLLFPATDTWKRSWRCFPSRMFPCCSQELPGQPREVTSWDSFSQEKASWIFARHSWKLPLCF